MQNVAERSLQGNANRAADPSAADPAAADTPGDAPGPQREIGGPTGPEPTRYGDWEKKGRCIDF